MATVSSIQWTDATWNIAVGCTKVDADCKYCYMYRESLNSTRYDPKIIRRTKTVFKMPLKLKEPSKIFTCSLTDFFHEELDEYRHEAWQIIKECPLHIFQILTKRPERITECLPTDFFEGGYEHVWIGTSIGSQDAVKRVGDLVMAFCMQQKIFTNLFLSIEPMHGPINLNDLTVDIGTLKYQAIRSINWVIVGGESGNNNGAYRYRPCEIDWIYKVISDCRKWGIPCFVKQLGTDLANRFNLKNRHGGDINEWPSELLKVRQFPADMQSLNLYRHIELNKFHYREHLENRSLMFKNAKDHYLFDKFRNK